MIKQYREQVAIVDACQYDGTNEAEIVAWSEGKVSETPEGGLQIESAGSFTPVDATDWVVCDVYKNWWKMLDTHFQISYAPGPSV